MTQPTDRAARIAAGATSGAAAALFLACALLSYRRHVHIDELTPLYSIQLGAAFGHPEYGVIELSGVLFQSLARLLASSQRLFVGFRVLELTLLCALCWSIGQVQRSMPSPLGRAGVFLAAVCFGPLWRHGFEVRHDMFLAFAIVLLAWAAERARLGQLGLWAASVTGCGVILAQANSSKAFTIWLPALALCALLTARGQRPWQKRLLAAGLRFVPGILLGGVAVAAVLGAAGVLQEYGQQLRQFASYSSAPPYRLSAWPLLAFAVQRAPVHAGFVLLGLLSVARRLALRRPLAEALVPLGVFALSGLSIAVNPTPFPYNLTWLTPAWLLMAAHGFSRSLALIGRVRSGPRPGVSFAAAAAALAVFFFWNCEQDPYYRKTWEGQLRVVASVEALTSPDDPVLDLCGLVLSRPPVAKDWVVHSLLMPAYHAGKREAVREIINRVWPPAAVTVYRWSFLDRADWLSFKRNYVRFSDDVWTLGGTLNADSTVFEVHRAGRYRVRASGDAGILDGHAIRGDDVLFLERGTHPLHATTSFSIAWNGPGDPGPPAPAANPLFVQGELPGQRDRR